MAPEYGAKMGQLYIVNCNLIKCMLSTVEWWIIDIKGLDYMCVVKYSECSSDCLEPDLVIRSNTVR